jgi:manganese oxidase
MVMGDKGMPDNTVPMMTGQVPYGSVEMGGIFSILKVRKDLKAGDYKDPGWFKPPAGTVAYEWTGPLSQPAPQVDKVSTPQLEMSVRKPTGHQGH